MTKVTLEVSDLFEELDHLAVEKQLGTETGVRRASANPASGSVTASFALWSARCAGRCSICDVELQCMPAGRVGVKSVKHKISYQGDLQRLNPLIEESRELYKILHTIQCLEVKGMAGSFV